VRGQLADHTDVVGRFVAVGNLGFRCEERLHGVSHPFGVHWYLRSFVVEVWRGVGTDMMRTGV
jgi:hypothetical protein